MQRDDNAGDQVWNKRILIGLLVAGVVLVLLLPAFVRPDPVSMITIDELLAQVQAGRVEQLTVSEDGQRVVATFRDGHRAEAQKEPGGTIYEYLDQAGIRPDQRPAIQVQAPSPFAGLLGSMTILFPLLLMGGILLVFLLGNRQQQGGSDQAFSFGKSRARRFAPDKPTATFTDVAGVDEAKLELQEVVDFLKYRQKYATLGARIPKGVLLVGPPGTGKTLLARAVAGDAGVPFFSISGSEFVELFVGVGAARVRDLFEQAKRNSPCIVFVDEIDAVGRQRGTGLGGSHDEREQTLNQILVEMDGFDARTNIIVIAATNRPDILDPALLRPGRFDRQVVLDRPDVNGRKAILEVHAKDKPVEPGVDLGILAKQTAGFSGADLANLLNEAAILAGRRGRETIGLRELEEAMDRVVAGPERKSRVISDKEKAITAYHEMGHAVVAAALPNTDTVHKVTIVPRGSMGGYTRLLPTEDRYLWTQNQFRDTLAWALGGRVAEEIMFGDVTTGASNDIERASQIARRMVTEYGMSKRLGPVAFGKREEMVFLGREIAEQRNYSEEVAREIDKEVSDLIEEAYERARKLLLANRTLLVESSDRLKEVETLEGEELQGLLGRVRPEPALRDVAATEAAAPVQTAAYRAAEPGERAR